MNEKMRDIRDRIPMLAVLVLLLCSMISSALAQKLDEPADVPADIQAVLKKSIYNGALWGLQVVDLATGQTLINLEPHHEFLIGSVRKVFSVGELMNQIGPTHAFDTPVYRQGDISDNGVLQGNLILVASGDLTMGGRTNSDGTVAISNFDHNEANSLGNAVLTKPDPLAGYAELARQIAASRIKEIAGDIAVDDRLFEPYNFRDEFELKPIFVNDDAVDVIIRPTELGQLASLEYRPKSAALAIKNAVVMRTEDNEINIDPTLPTCIGRPGCAVTLSGDLPVGFKPPLTGDYPLIRTFRIVEPSNYARTVLIEKLRAAGVKVDAPTVEENPVQLLPAKNSYRTDMRVALLRGLPYSEDAKLVNKVSYNIGADTSLLLYGLTQGVDNMESTLAIEKKNLQANYGISSTEYHFIDGSGSAETAATNHAVTHFLANMSTRTIFPQYRASFPILGIDGSLATVTDFEADRTLAPAEGQVQAKTGTFIANTAAGPRIRGQAFAGYIHAKSGKTLVYHVVVNDVPFKNISDVIQVFQDEGTISAILWRDN